MARSRTSGFHQAVGAAYPWISTRAGAFGDPSNGGLLLAVPTG
ncbi:hypothetical protein [Streptomyces sp. NPDC088360]